MSLSWPAAPGTYLNVTINTLGAVGSGNFTVVALTNLNGANHGVWSAGAGATYDYQILSDTGTWYGGGDFSGFTGTPGAPVTGDWQVIGQSKTSGSNVYRWHFWDYTTNSAKVHTDGTGTHANPGTITGMRLGDTENRGNGLIAAIAVWKRVLSDAEFNSLCTSNLSDWMVVSGGPPDAIWAMNVAAASVVDGSGNGNNIASVVGTISAGADPPGFNYTLTSATPAPSVSLAGPGRISPSGRFQFNTPFDYTTASATSPTAEATSATGTAFDASVSVAPNAEATSGTGTALDAAGSVGANAENTTATGTASNPAADVQANAGNATATGTAYDAAASIAVNAELASAAGTAYDATVSTSANTQAPAELTTAAVTAYDAAASVGVSAENAAAAGTAYDATVSIGTNAAAATGTAAAFDAAVSIGAQAEATAATGFAFVAALAIQANAEAAAALGAALAPTIGGATIKATSTSSVTATRSSTAAVTARRTSTATVE